jgi:hypothetical protein
VIEGNAEKILKGFAVANEELGHLVGEIVLRFEYDDFEHEDGEKGTKSLLIKHSPIDIGGEAFEKIIELVKFIAIRFGGNQIRLHRH